MCAKEAEKIEEQLSNGRSATGRTKVTEKDLSKVDNIFGVVIPHFQTLTGLIQVKSGCCLCS